MLNMSVLMFKKEIGQFDIIGNIFTYLQNGSQMQASNQKPYFSQFQVYEIKANFTKYSSFQGFVDLVNGKTSKIALNSKNVSFVKRGGTFIRTFQYFCSHITHEIFMAFSQMIQNDTLFRHHHRRRCNKYQIFFRVLPEPPKLLLLLQRAM